MLLFDPPVKVTVTPAVVYMSNMPFTVKSPPIDKVCVVSALDPAVKLPPERMDTLPATVTARAVPSKVRIPLVPCPTVIDATETA